MLLKRFESSGYAFQRTIDTMIKSHDIFLGALDEGWVITGDALRQWMATDSDEMEEFIGSLDADTAERHVAPISDYDVDGLRSAVEADRIRLGELRDEAKSADGLADPKVEALVEQLAAIAAQAEEDGATEHQRRDNRKVLVFSYFSDTVEYLHGELLRAVESDDRLAAYRGRIETATGSDKNHQAMVIAGVRTSDGRRRERRGPVRPRHHDRRARRGREPPAGSPHHQLRPAVEPDAARSALRSNRPHRLRRTPRSSSGCSSQRPSSTRCSRSKTVSRRRSSGRQRP